MAPMANIRAVPTAVRSATARGEHLRPLIRATQPRRIATNAAIQEPTVEFPGGIPPVQVPQRKSALEQRIAAVKAAKPFSDFLTDTFNRQHDYLRISITERCNLRCLYCMPEEGIPLSPAAHMLTTPEIFYLSSLFVSQGVTKIRLTGGEPTVRRDIVPLMQQIGSLRSNGLRELALTTNGIALHRKLDAMVEAGLTGVNLSLDTLDPFQFQIMTRRNGFEAVMKSINRILDMNKMGANVKLKVNCVVMRGLNEREIIPFVEMGREKEIEVRFIEYMPFGGNKWSQGKMISFQEMLDIIRTKYPDLRRVPGHKNDTSKTFEVPGFVGKVGFITSMTNDFCGTCNRLRITSDGNLKVCLHGNAEVSLRDVLRQGNDGQPIDEEAFERIKQIEMDRHEGRLSDETILGWGPRERELLDVIGTAVKRKAEKHADMGDLENMTNRPMILIDRTIASASPPPGLKPARSGLTSSAKLRFPLPTMRSPAAPYLYHPATHTSNFSQVRALSTGRTGAEIALPQDHAGSIEAESSSPPVDSLYSTSEEKYRAALQAVSEHGMQHAQLPPTFEAVRQKYNMTGAEFDKYWEQAAESQMMGPDATQLQAKARRTLKKMNEKLDDPAMKNTTPSHKTLMKEAWRDFAQIIAEDDISQKSKAAKKTKVTKSGKTEKARRRKTLPALETSPATNSNPIRSAPTTLAMKTPVRTTPATTTPAATTPTTTASATTTPATTTPATTTLAPDEEQTNPVMPEPEWQIRIRSAQALLADIKADQPRSPTPQNVDQALRQVAQQLGKLKAIRTGLMMDILRASAPGETIPPDESIKEAVTRRKRWRQLKRASALKEREASEEQMHKQMKEIEEVQATLRQYKQQLMALKPNELEQQDKVEELKQRRADMLRRKTELLESLQEIPPTKTAPTKTVEEKKASFDLNDILDVAVEEATEALVAHTKMHLPAPAVTSRRPSPLSAEMELGDAPHPAVKRTDVPRSAEAKPAMMTYKPQPAVVAGRHSSFDADNNSGIASASSSTAATFSQKDVKSSGLEFAQRPRPSDSLRLDIPQSRKIEVDSDLIVDLNADIPQLQKFVFQMQERLKSSYPRVDSLPYEIWKSQNRNTLQTWLKILITRWKGRFDDVATMVGATIDPQVKAVLDQMVRDHDLSNEGAKRMAKKWVEIMHNQGAISSDVGGVIDWDEFDAGGMGFLRSDEQGGEDDVMESDEAEGVNTAQAHVPRSATRASFATITRRLYSTSSRPPLDPTLAPKQEQPSSQTSSRSPTQHPSLPHLTPSGSAHMVSVSAKPHTVRTAIAVGTVYFSNPTPLQLIKSNSLKKGDVLSVSRIAGIMAAKKCPDLIPLCHPIPLTHVGVELRVFSSPSPPTSSSSSTNTDSASEKINTNDLGHGGVAIEAKVSCTGPTGVEMEALTSVMGTALSVVDMCKAVDKFQRVQDVRVVLKEGGKSGVWKEEGWRSWQTTEDGV
ncbi:hypothetical protein FB567DRAFT_531907 [Paraphoma chrysanthemicola]|uniref:Radical SAM core domain-containing protein n=1 Tax=Paraphoma chrysanthemicola TaxID=798071 RepID=A0A8K0VWG1_9PLEO|nr:hypothetical protein FB567DRAFT_531907 [Paraphoma chrysanthemicola]